MAQPYQTGHPIVTADNPIAVLLSAQLSPHWTMEGLVEQLLRTIADQPLLGAEEILEFVLDADGTTDRQSRRMLRPLLACLATKSAAENGTPANLYGGRLSFKRPGPVGSVWILGQFENRPGTIRIALRRSNSPPEIAEPATQHLPILTDADLRPADL